MTTPIITDPDDREARLRHFAVLSPQQQAEAVRRLHTFAGYGLNTISSITGLDPRVIADLIGEARL